MMVQVTPRPCDNVISWEGAPAPRGRITHRLPKRAAEHTPTYLLMVSDGNGKLVGRGSMGAGEGKEKGGDWEQRERLKAVRVPPKRSTVEPKPTGLLLCHRFLWIPSLDIIK